MSDRGFNCPKWYDIPGIEFIYMGNVSDPNISFEGVTDNSCVTVEDTMWSMYTEEFPEPDYSGGHYSDYVDRFSDYMRDNADEVKNLIRMARGQIEYY